MMIIRKNIRMKNLINNLKKGIKNKRKQQKQIIERD